MGLTDSGYTVLTTNNYRVYDIYKSMQAEIPSFGSVSDFIRAMNRVIADINSKTPGLIATDEIETVIASTAKSVTITDASSVMRVQDNNVVTPGFGDVVAGDYLRFERISAGNYEIDINDGLMQLSAASDTILSIPVAQYGNDFTTGSQTQQMAVYRLPRAYAYNPAIKTASAQYDIDSANQVLFLAKDVKEVLEFYISDIAYEKRSHEYVFDSNNSSEKVYCVDDRGSLRWGSSNFGAEGTVMKLKVLRSLRTLDPALVDLSVQYLNIPLTWKELLMAGCRVYIYSLPKFKNEDMFVLASKEYASLLDTATTWETDRFPSTVETPNYRY
tara:strand:- start:652 stop:1641 length:990 start_codon:yes stop_codon:yes gene_type:complete